MYLRLFSLLIIMLAGTNGIPLNFSVYNKLVFISEQKCPYLKTTKLLESDRDFLSQCSSVAALHSLKEVTTDNVHDALCLLYYYNFERLCLISNTYLNATQQLISNTTVEEALQSHHNKELVCKMLRSNPYFVKSIQEPGAEALSHAFADDATCLRMCTDFRGSIKPICSTNVFMLNITMKLNNQTATQNPGSTDVKIERGASKVKPHYTEPNGDTVDNSQSQNAVLSPKDRKQGEQSESAHNLIQNQVVTNVTGTSSVAGSPKNMSTLPIPAIVAVTQGVASDQSANLQNSQNQSQAITNPISQSNEAKQPTPLHFSPQHKTSSSDLPNVDYTVHADSETADQSKTTAPVLQSNVNYEAAKPAEHVETPVKTESEVERPQLSNKNNPGGSFKVAQLEKSEGMAQVPDVRMQQEHLSETLPQQTDSEVTRDQGIGTNSHQFPMPMENAPQKEEAVEKELEADDQPGQDEPDDGMGVASENEGDGDYNNIDEIPPKPSEVKTKPTEKSKPLEIDEDFAANFQNQSIDDSDSYFFSYFMMVCIMFICGYVAYHNKQKILALVVEGRRGRRPSRTRRPNSANYRKLDSNLEEAVTSSCNKNATQVIY